MRIASLPPRLATGAFILHEGLGKLRGDEERAKGVHGAAADAYPFLQHVPPTRFLRLLGIAEVTLGAALLVPFVPDRLAGTGLTAFSGGLLGMYLRTPGMHEPGSVWPTPDGLAVSKDVWMLGIGVGLVASRSRP
ncbi:DoxX family membrane protein [Cellulomonas sp. DKR-3]|uniref:DoxX family membrane protein n=1 Tax=Cellulomonas fulva TaxID=2835530 RepID=A0ABS5TWE6_9CELL|nr:DoxX family membrane protein [Cellulomonas fulva]MBT0993429.1 DoxX family membrane protein [Cellulomonas fulva]